MSNENEPEEQTEEVEVDTGTTDENANKTPAGSRAPSRAKSRGSIGDERKTITRQGGRSTVHPDSILSGIDDNESALDDQASETTCSESNGFDTDLEVEGVLFSVTIF